MSLEKQTTRLEALDSWRGVCALLVAAFHFPIYGMVRSVELVANAYLFVDFFFVLSGYVIGRGYETRLSRPEEIWPFIVRRFGRVWPLHAATLALFVVVAVARGKLNADPEHSLMAVFTNIAMIQGLGIHHVLTWNDPSWSISVEFLLYIVFSILSFSDRKTAIYIALIGFSLAILIFVAPYGMASTFDFGVFRGFAGFFTGVLVARLPLVDRGAWVELLVTLGVALFVSFGRLQFLAPAVFASAVWVYAASDGPLARLMKTRVPMALGRWSYSIYMTHTIVAGVIWALADRLDLVTDGVHLRAAPWREAVIFTGYIGATIATSFVTFTLIENPARQWFDRRSRAARLARA